ncbi:molybdenum cofactor guanylyltransferase [Aurantiacibacter xanthus]|uniref:Molybdenum cofactor guanylyltransferase n=1 Tax=Aurantiacibacter xanthus TaxID=1784712 RepID=A0A3A1P6N7_9SPHN|nr:molybdenum cofactor guanylyltransferase [Aurantiacibacter xanthus]RIV82991.1 molybdenum cofactor guanylyltransferase [Aurantiacibacter xanthus]
MILGAVLAGGMSTRFGSDKALAVLDGRTLLERAVEALAQLCDKVVIVGRTAGPAPCIPDAPRPGMGPLGGVSGALNHARDHQFASVLTTSVDSFGLPQNLLELLSPASAYLEKQPVIGHWNTDAASIAERILQSEGRHSMIAFAKAANARGVQSASTPANINTPADLAALEH